MNDDISFTIQEIKVIKHALGIKEGHMSYRNGYVLTSLISPSPVVDLMYKGVLVKNEGVEGNRIELYVHPYWQEIFCKLFDKEII